MLTNVGMWYMLIYYFSYEERNRSLQTIIDKHMDRTTYEEFISQVFSPVMGSGPYYSRSVSNPGPTCNSVTSTLTAALLDHNTASQHSHPHKPIRGQSEHDWWCTDCTYILTNFYFNFLKEVLEIQYLPKYLYLFIK